MKLKTLKPTLRERKRYIVFEAISNKVIIAKQAKKAIENALMDYCGVNGSAKAGMIFLADKYDDKKQTGIVRVCHKSVEDIKSALCLITKINNDPVLFRSLGVSGILNKTKKWRMS